MRSQSRSTAFITVASVLALALVCLARATPTAAWAAPLPAGRQAAAPAPAGVTSRITVLLPHEEADLTVDGRAVEGDGTSRTVETRPLPRGSVQRYEVSAIWMPNSYTTMTRTKSIVFRAGEAVRVDLTVDDPGDRVRVIYVPTPADIGEAMVTLAAVAMGDVVYEPGCGDARVTIAALARGARRAICVDIDPDRVDESRANVTKAGLDRRIDVRLGDALDVKDLSDVTVVFLYMGDHFNMLIRPVLWKQLPVGARIVSHRFTMGDWQPDRTLTINSSEGGMYELHLWTVTEEIKRKLK